MAKMTSEANPAIEHEPLVFYDDADKLSDMAAVSLTSSLLYDHTVYARISRQADVPFEEYPEDCLTSSVMPDSIVRSISDLLQTMEKKRNKWRDFHYKYVFFDRGSRDDVIDLLGELMWTADGSIRYESTAKKLIKCGRLSRVEEFRMAAVYCFEDDVQTAWTKMTADEIRNETDREKDHTLVHHWCCKMAGLPIPEDDDPVSMGSELIDGTDFDIWPVFKYLWNSATVEEQAGMLDVLAQCCTMPGVVIRLLPKLPKSRVDALFAKYGDMIVWSLAAVPKLSKHVPVLVRRLMNLIDDELLGAMLVGVDAVGLEFGREYANSLVLEIWQRADDDAKNKIAVECAEDLIEESLDRRRGSKPDPDTDYNIPLILDILKRNEFEYRAKYWRKYWLKLTVGQLSRHKTRIEQMMKLCLADEQQIVAFKSAQMTDIKLIAPSCRRLLRGGRFETLDEYVKFACNADPHKMVELKKDILNASSKSVFALTMSETCAHSTVAADLNRFVEGVFTIDQFRQYKNQLFESNDEFLSKLHETHICSAIRFVKAYSLDDTMTAKVKDGFVQYFRECLLGKEIPLASADQWTSCLKWCYDGDENRVDQFKRSLQLDEIFAKQIEFLVRGIIKHLRACPGMRERPTEATRKLAELLADFQTFLGWVMGDSQAVNRFKVEKIGQQWGVEYLMEVLANEFGEMIVDKVLEWCFDRDVRLIEEFKGMHFRGSSP